MRKRQKKAKGGSFGALSKTRTFICLQSTVHEMYYISCTVGQRDGLWFGFLFLLVKCSQFFGNFKKGLWRIMDIFKWPHTIPV